MAAIGDIVLVSLRGTMPPTWDEGQIEHPAIVTGTYPDPNVIDAQVFVRNYGPAQKAGIKNESVATAPSTGGQWTSWRVPPA